MKIISANKFSEIFIFILALANDIHWISRKRRPLMKLWDWIYLLKKLQKNLLYQRKLKFLLLSLIIPKNISSNFLEISYGTKCFHDDFNYFYIA